MLHSYSLRYIRHSAGWKKFEGIWNLLIRTKQVAHALPILEGVLAGFGAFKAVESVVATIQSLV